MSDINGLSDDKYIRANYIINTTSLYDLIKDHVNITNSYQDRDYIPESTKSIEELLEKKTELSKSSDYNIEKIRPKVELYYNNGNDGRDGHDSIRYRCQRCNRIIRDYRAETACDQCGTFYDWGLGPAHIIYRPEIVWN